MLLINFFTVLVYQPFLNILVFLYWAMDLLTAGQPDMGIAVVLLTIVIRFLLLPMSLAGHRSEAERRELAQKIKTLELEFGENEVGYKKARKSVLHQSRRVVIGELFSLFVQVMIALMLWRIFARGLTGEDLHLIYPWMPTIDTPFKLLFLGKYDLSHPSWILNLLQSALIFIYETLSSLTSPFPTSRREVIRLQLTLPLISFLIFMNLPAGKKLFVITTLIFSIILTSIKYVQRRFEDYKAKVAARQAALAGNQDEKVVVEVKE